MRSTLLCLIALFTQPLAASTANATITAGRWAPDPSQTAEYCIDSVCSTQLFDASIHINAPSVGDLFTIQTALRFPDLSPEFSVVAGGTFLRPSALPFEFTQTFGAPIEGLPDFGNRFDFRFESDSVLFLTGFVSAADEGSPSIEIRFDRALFVPIPEPSVAALVGFGLLILSTKRLERETRSRLSDPGCRPPIP